MSRHELDARANFDKNNHDDDKAIIAINTPSEMPTLSPPRPTSRASTNNLRPSSTRAATPTSRIRTAGTTIIHHATKHTGVGLVCAVAYFDPGNWGVDLQAGSQFGYHLLFIVLLAGLLAVYWQVLASRLGVVTGLDLATHIRLLLHSRGRHPRLIRWLMLYPLYILAEAAIVATDLAEVLGSGIALCLLFPSLPLWGGVLLTSADVFILLLIGDPLKGRPVRVFEVFVGAMVVAVLICMAIIVGRINPHWPDVFQGFLPSKHIVQNGGLYVSVGIVGATVMPHSLFLGSALSAQDRLSTKPKATLSIPMTLSHESERSSPLRIAISSLWQSIRTALVPRRTDDIGTTVNRHCDHTNRPLSFVSAHLRHAVVDVISSLLGFAVLINSFILVLASAVFFYGPAPADGSSDSGSPASLFDAHALISSRVGKGAGTLFAVSLLFAGQSAALIGTLAGQVVADGFVQWSAPPVLRRLIARAVSLVPGMVVAAVKGRDGVDALLVASQVVLAFVLPFVTLPLLLLTSSKEVMRVKDEDHVGGAVGEEGNVGETISFANGRVSQAFGWIVWVVLVVANVYVLVELGRGET